MAVYATVIMVILAIIMAIFIILSILKEDSNNKKNQHNIIYPFNAKLQSRDSEHTHGSYSVRLLQQDGKTDQIQCPAGTHINVIGAWTDVVDPNGTCSGQTSLTFKKSCGYTQDLSGGITCNDISDCAEGMTCSGAQTCVPLACNTNANCSGTYCGKSGTAHETAGAVGQPCTGYNFTDSDGLVCIGGIVHKDPPSGQCLYCNLDQPGDGVDANGNPITWAGHCAQSASCANLDSDTGQNNTCTTENNSCVSRDVSAYLAGQCDGQRNCPVLWDPSDSTYFGPKPCYSLDVNWQTPGTGAAFDGPPDGTNVSQYEQLPIISGWDGSAPGSGQYQTEKSQPSTYSQGYYVHGLFQCLPDDQ